MCKKKIIQILILALISSSASAVCPEGKQYSSFYLETLQTLPDKKLLEEIKVEQDWLNFIEPSRLQFRADLCVGFDDENNPEIEVTQILLHDHSGSSGNGDFVFTQKDSQVWNVTGLFEAMFGEPSKLNIEIIPNGGFRPSPEGRDSIEIALQIRSLSDGNVVALRKYRTEKEMLWRALTGSIAVGKFNIGNPFNGKCPARQKQKDKLIELGTAKIHFYGCTFMGGGRSTGFSIHKVTLEDSNPLVPEKHRNREVVFSGDDLSSSFKYKWNHHNECDTFELKVGSAEYSGTMHPGVRVRRCEKPVGYYVKYGDNQIDIGFRKHFLLW